MEGTMFTWMTTSGAEPGGRYSSRTGGHLSESILLGLVPFGEGIVTHTHMELFTPLPSPSFTIVSIHDYIFSSHDDSIAWLMVCQQGYCMHTLPLVPMHVQASEPQGVLLPGSGNLVAPLMGSHGHQRCRLYDSDPGSEREAGH